MKCTRQFKTCRGETDKTVMNKPVCPGCREKWEKFDQELEQ